VNFKLIYIADSKKCLENKIKAFTYKNGHRWYKEEEDKVKGGI
jgi:hypothetical protein